MKLTPEQEKVAQFKDGNLQIIAAAGSGKTTSIASRIANLIKSGVSPRSIIAFTFTEKAAEVMKFKINKAVTSIMNSPGDLNEMYVGTIHSFCFELLKEHEPKYLSYEVMDDNQRVLFFKKYYFQLGLNHSDVNHYVSWISHNSSWTTISNAISNMDIIREEMVNHKKIKNKAFKSVYIKYRELLEEKKYLDFSSMMEVAVEMMSDKTILSDVRDRIKYLIVDEYQDINPIQEKIIQLISGGKNVCVVGDDDQSIYQWRGTKVKNMLTFAKRYKKVIQIRLLDNFRSTPGIITQANQIISKIPENKRLQKEMKPGNPNRVYEAGDIYLSDFESQSQEIEFAIQKMKELRGTAIIEDGTERAIDWRDFAFIFRSVKKSAPRFIERLKEENIPFVVKGSVGLFDRKEIKLLIDILAFILEPEYDIKYNLKSPESQETFKRLFQDKLPDYDKVLKEIAKIKKYVQSQKFLNLQNIFHRVLNVIGAKEFFIKDEILFNLAKLSKVVSDYEGQYYPVPNNKKNLGYMFEFLFEYAANTYEEGRAEEKFGSVNAVHLMTMHQCKGLEFPAVFMSSLTKQNFPASSNSKLKWFIPDSLIDKTDYDSPQENQRRLLYVAITRSMKYLFISSSKKMPDYVREQKPCEFTADLSDKCLLKKAEKDPTERKKSNNFTISPNEIFPTNYSELSDYFECPYCFKLKAVLGFQPAISQLIGYGKSVHNILNIIHKLSRKKKEINVDKIINSNFHLRFAKPEDAQKAKETAGLVIKNYLDNYKDDMALSLETERPFEIAIGKTLISGQVDLIRKDTPKGEEVTIIDFKTERDPEDYRKEMHREQVILYGTAYKLAFGKQPHKLFVHYLDQKGGKREEVPFTQDSSDKLLKKIDNAVENIKKGEFKGESKAKKRKSDFGLMCKHCDF